jgi:hypothetical protein
MSDPAKVLDRMLRENNFELERGRKHQIYRQKSTNRIFVTPSSGSDNYRGLKNAISSLNKVLAAPPRSEVLTLAEFEENERKIQLSKQQKVSAGSSAPKKSKGCGILYIDRKTPSQPMTAEQKEKSRKASEWAKQRNLAADHERKQRNNFEYCITDFLRTNFFDSMHKNFEHLGPDIRKNIAEEPDKIERAIEHQFCVVMKSAKPVISKLCRLCIQVEPVGNNKVAVGFAEPDSLDTPENREEMEAELPFPSAERKGIVDDILFSAKYWLEKMHEAKSACEVAESLCTV